MISDLDLLKGQTANTNHPNINDSPKYDKIFNI